MKKRLVLIFVLLGISLFAEEIKVGVIYDGVSDQNEILESTLKEELGNILGSEYEIMFPELYQVTSNYDYGDIKEKIDAMSKNEDIDIIIAGGILSSVAASEIDDLSKATFAPFAFKNLDDKILNDNRSNKKNLNYIMYDVQLNTEIETFKEIVDFDKVLFLIGEELEVIKPKIEKIVAERNLNVDYEIISFKEDIDKIYDKIYSSEAVMIGPMEKFDREILLKLYKDISDKKIPIFSTLGSVDLKDGILAGHSYKNTLKKRLRILSLNVYSYLKGTPVKDLPVYIQAEEHTLEINMEVVEKTGLWPDWDMIAKANLINFQVAREESTYSLNEVLEMSLKNNLEIRALKKELIEQDIKIKKTKGIYLPHIDAKVNGVVIDEDRGGSPGFQAENTAHASIELTQVIFNDDVSMAIDIEKKNLDILKSEIKQKEMDVILETAEAYFSILKAEAFTNIQKNNLELTKTNLEIAKSRKNAGISGASEVYRWESELANNMSNLMEAITNVSLAKTNLKRIINYDFDKNIYVKNVEYLSDLLLSGEGKFRKYLENNSQTKILIESLEKEALKNSPELASIDLGKDINKRLKRNSKYKRYMPQVAVQANHTWANILESGVGEDIDTGIDDENWSVGVQVSIPLYSGGETYNETKRIAKRIEIIEDQKKILENILIQRVNSSVLKMVSEYSKIENAKKSVEAAEKALDLVKDSYFRGVVSISVLIDAQTAFIGAKRYQEAVVYDFLLALMESERAIGKYSIRMDKEEKKEYLDKILK